MSEKQMEKSVDHTHMVSFCWLGRFKNLQPTHEIGGKGTRKNKKFNKLVNFLTFWTG